MQNEVDEDEECLHDRGVSEHYCIDCERLVIKNARELRNFIYSAIYDRGVIPFEMDGDEEIDDDSASFTLVHPSGRTFSVLVLAK